MHHGIIFTGANYPDSGRKSGGAKRIANFLKEHHWDIEVVDYFSFWSEDQLKELLSNRVTNNTKWIGFSYTWLSNDGSIASRIQLIKQWYPNLLIIAGGQTPFESDLGADYYVFGYGEEATLKVLNYEFNGGPAVMYNRMFAGKYIDGINSYPSHNLKEYGINYDNNDYLSPTDSITIELSRGCKFACKFCNFPYIGIKEDTSRSEESIYRELNENYQKWGITNYLIADDTLNDRQEKLIKFRNAVTRLDFKPNFSGYIRLDLFKAHPEQMELLAESRMWAHFYGIETFCHDSGKIIGKGMHPDTMKDLMLKTKDYFNKHVGYYRGSASMIAGLPKESVNQMIDNHKWLVENWSDQAVIWYPLQIMRSEGTVQAFGQNLSKYGYEEIAGPSEEQYEKWMRGSLIPKIKEKNLYWKNEHTNSFEVFDLVAEFRKHKFAISNWALWSYCSHFNIDDVMAMRTEPFDVYSYEPYVERSMHMINNYIAKKLR